jgi:hypothetical protein
MAGSKTSYLSQKILAHVLGEAVYTRPSTLWLCLSMVAFTPGATGTAMNEVAASGYARLSLPNNVTIWSAATAAEPSEKHNLADMVFPTAGASWGTPLSAYLADAATLGNLLYGADITNPQQIKTGDIPRVLAETFVLHEG